MGIRKWGVGTRFLITCRLIIVPMLLMQCRQCVIRHLSGRINPSHHTPDLIPLLLSPRLCCWSRNPHATESGCKYGVIVPWLLSVGAMKAKETGEHANVGENVTCHVMIGDHVYDHQMSEIDRALD